MTAWQMPLSKNHQVTLSADARFCHPDYLNDNTWLFNSGLGDPAALSLDSTLGLRVRLARMFPRFSQRGAIVSDPASFAQSPLLNAVYPNYIRTTYQPLVSIKVTHEVWVASSQMVCGRLRMENLSVLPEAFWMEWDCVVDPSAAGRAMEVRKEGLITFLHGSTGEQDLVCFLSGGANPGKGPYSGLGVQVELEAGSSHLLSWGFTIADGFENAAQDIRQATMTSMEPEVVRLEIINQRDEVVIQSGDQNIDLAMMLSQRYAQRLVHGRSQHLPENTFVASRKPDQGNSIRGDGTDYPPAWSGQTALDAYLMAQHLLPSRVATARGFLNNFIHVQAEDGFIDWRPGLAGQRSKRLAQPMLASLAWSIYRVERRLDFLAEVYQPLLRFIKRWFSPEHDRDEDGYPEWDNPLQAGMEENPLFDRFTKGSQGADIQRIESPTLAAMLYRECRILIKMAELTQQSEDADWLQERAATLKDAVVSTWDAREHSYRYRDFTTHQSHPSEYIQSIQENGDHHLDKKLKQPARLLLRFATQDEMTRPMRITLFGEDRSGLFSEPVPPYEFYWIQGQGRYTTQRVYNRLIRIEVQGLAPGDLGEITTIDFSHQDISLLLPIWAGLAPAEHVSEVVEKKLPQLLHTFGIPVCPPTRSGLRQLWHDSVYPHWNLLVAEGLARYGYQKEAAALMERLMRAVSASVRNTLGFHERYHCNNGKPDGERDSLRGLIPTGTYLSLLGVNFLGSERVVIRDANPFSLPVTVKYAGMTVFRDMKDSVVTFPSGHSVTVTGTGSHLVSLS